MVDFNMLRERHKLLQQTKDQETMATRANAKFDIDTDTTDTTDLNHEGDTNIPPIPDEYIASDANTPPSISDLNQRGMNDVQDERERAKLDPPTGNWTKVDRWKFEERVNRDDNLPGDVNSDGRTTYNFSGYCEPRVANDIEYNPMFFIRMSPDLRRKQDDPDKVDLAYQMWLKAKDLHLALHNAKATNHAQIITMMEEDVFDVRTMKGDNGLVALSVQKKYEKGSRR